MSENYCLSIILQSLFHFNSWCHVKYISKSIKAFGLVKAHLVAMNRDKFNLAWTKSRPTLWNQRYALILNHMICGKLADTERKLWDCFLVENTDHFYGSLHSGLFISVSQPWVLHLFVLSRNSHKMVPRDSEFLWSHTFAIASV